MPSSDNAHAEVAALLGLFDTPTKEQHRLLVTAGPTCEDIDPVRFLSNRSTGRMGIAIAEAGQTAGHQVLLVLGPTTLEPPKGIQTIRVRTAREMHSAVSAAFDWCDALFMSAAVADYRPAEYVDEKIHKTDDDFVLRLVRNPDILGDLVEARTDQVVVGFSLDSHIDLFDADRKRRAKGMDIIVANTEHAFGGVSTDAVILERDAEPVAAPSTKTELAAELLRRTEALVADVRKSRTPSVRLTARRRIIHEEE